MQIIIQVTTHTVVYVQHQDFFPERLHLYKGDPESPHETVAFEPSLDGFKVS